MRVAVIVVFVSLLTTRSEASNVRMSKTEARQQFVQCTSLGMAGALLGRDTDASPWGSPSRASSRADAALVVPIPSPDLRRSANAMATDEPETELIIHGS